LLVKPLGILSQAQPRFGDVNKRGLLYGLFDALGNLDAFGSIEAIQLEQSVASPRCRHADPPHPLRVDNPNVGIGSSMVERKGCCGIPTTDQD
jgi:hypothetical protein